MSTTPDQTNSYGRIISLTDDGYKAINVPSKSKEHELIFEGTKIFLTYRVGNVKKRHNLTYSNMPILSGSRLVGKFDGKTYEKAALAELFNIEEGAVTADTHADVVRLLGSNAAVFFSNPFNKPPKNTPKDAAAYREWERGEKDKWETALIIFCNDKIQPPAPKEETKETANGGTEPPAQTAETPATNTTTETKEQPKEQPDVAKLTAAELFHNGVANNGYGIIWAKNALSQKQINHEKFVNHCQEIIEEGFLRGMDAYEEILPPAIAPTIDFLNGLKERNNSALAAMKIAGLTDANSEKENEESNAAIDELIKKLTSVLE